MEKKDYLEIVINEITEAKEAVDVDELYAFAMKLKDAERIFICGAGRSGFIARGFANRLMHLGKQIYFVGETTTPAIRKADLLVISSASGETDSLVSMVKKAKKIGCEVLLVSIHPDSTIGRMADYCLKLPGVTPKSEIASETVSVQPMGNLYEQISWLVFDSVIMIMIELTNMSTDEMFSRHANLE